MHFFLSAGMKLSHIRQMQRKLGENSPGNQPSGCQYGQCWNSCANTAGNFQKWATDKAYYTARSLPHMKCSCSHFSPLLQSPQTAQPKVSIRCQLSQTPGNPGLDGEVCLLYQILCLSCYGLHIVPPRFVGRNLNPQRLRMWLYLEIGPLDWYLQLNGFISISTNVV